MSRPMQLPTVLFLTLAAAAAGAQLVPEPTDFELLVTEPGTDLVVRQDFAAVESEESGMQLAVVEVPGSGAGPRRGVRLMLRNDDDVDELYLDQNQAEQFRRELMHLDVGYEDEVACRGRCYHGIERCRPSQSVVQAFCPSVYRSGNGERGLSLRTPLASFRFPATRPSVLADLLVAAAGELGSSANASSAERE